MTAFVPGSIVSKYSGTTTANATGFTPGSIVSKYTQTTPQATGGFVPGSIVAKYNGTTATPAQQQSAFSQTIQGVKSDPFNLKADPSKFFSDAVDSVKNIFVNEWNNIGALFQSKSVSEGIGNTLKTAVGAVPFIPAAAPYVFGFSVLFGAGKDVPVLGTVTKLIDASFNLVPEQASKISGEIVDKLPISQASKDNIKGGVEQAASLAAQIGEFMLLHKVISPYLPSERAAAPFKDQFVKDNPAYAEDIKKVPGKQINKIVKENPEDAQAIVKKAIDINRIQKKQPPLTPEQPMPEEIKTFIQQNQPTQPPESPLAQEATKYKSAEEFVKAITEDRGGIGAGVDYSPAKRMVETDINDTPLTNFGFKPGDKVTIYRGVDRASQKTIQSGDYIATSYDLAKSYTGGRVISKEVPASSVRFSSGDGIMASDFKNGFNETHLEGVYNPEPLVKQSQLTDIYNQAVKTAPEVKVDPVKVQADAKILEQKFTDEKGNVDPIFKGTTLERQDALKNDLLSTIDKTTAIDLSFGNKPMPKGFEELRPTYLAEALAKDIKNLTFDEFKRLVDNPNKTPYSQSTAGSELSLSRGVNDLNPVNAIKDIEKARTERATKKGETTTPKKGDIMDTLKGIICK